jgi:pSer/pThr/pTyr-binding forkhead associated (FHA) protein
MPNRSQEKKGEFRAVIYILSGSGTGDAVKLRQDATLFGREKGDIIIDDVEMSSTHCQIQNINSSYHIFDMNSTNGTFVNKIRIVKSRLNTNDEVTIGKTTFRFAIEEDAKVRHLNTVFKSNTAAPSKANSSIVDTLIEKGAQKKNNYILALWIKYANGVTETIDLPQRQVYLGRATSFGQFENDVEISRKHLLIKINDLGEVFIEDQGSTNGTMLNNTKVKGMLRAQPTDLIRMGGIEIRAQVKVRTP